MQTTQVDLNQTKEIDSLTDWIHKNFVENKPKCIKDNQAQLICIDKYCSEKSPFICLTKNCACFKQHKVCSVRNIQFFLQEIRQKQIKNVQFSQLQGMVHRQTNGLIQKIATIRDRILQRIRNGQIRQSFKKIERQKNQRLKELLKQQITGSVIFDLLNQQLIDSNQSNQYWLNKFQGQFSQIFKKFEQKKLEPFCLQLNNVLFQPTNKQLQWSPSLNDLKIKVNMNNLTYNGESSQNSKVHKIAMLQHGISKFVGKIIKWKIKILKMPALNYPPWIGLGIGLRQSLRKKKFYITDEKNEECYMVVNNQTVYAGLDLDRNLNKQYGIKFNENDTIEIQLDTTKWTIKFKNLTTLKSTQLKIMRIPQIDQDDYHICVAFTNKDDSVQIISPIETSLEKYQV